MPLPAMSGAEPWTGSKRPGSPSAPRLAEGSIPRLPVSIAASSLRMSPKRFSATITSKSAGRETSCIAALSTSRWSSVTSGVVGGDAGDDLAPEPRGLHHVGLVDRGDLRLVAGALGAAAGGLEGGAGDALDFGGVVLAGVEGGVAVAAGLAEVDAAGELADDQQVGAGDALLAQRAGAHQRRARADRAQVGVEAHPLAEAEQALLGARVVGVGRVPFGTADRAEQDRVGGLAGVQHLVGEGDAVGVDRAAAHEALVVVELAQGVEDLAGGGDDLGADPVTGQDDDVGGLRHGGDSTQAARGFDVQAHVVERQRVAPGWRGRRRRTGRCSSSGQLGDVGAEADRLA